MTAIALEGARFGAGMTAWQRRRVKRVLRHRLAPGSMSPLRRWLSAMSGYSEAMAEALVKHSWGKTSFTMPAEMYLALCTVVPTSASTGASIEGTEATYTGYVRLKLNLTQFAATKAATSKIENENELTFAACTGEEKTVIGWATTEKKRGEACNVNMWGTCTSTVISATQTPPTVAAKKLVGELK